MSKKNAKNKNNQDDALLQEKAWLRDSYHMTLTEKALHERLERLEEENKELLAKMKVNSNVSNKEIQDLKDNVESLKDERDKLKKQKTDFEKDGILKSKKLEDQEDLYKKLLIHRQEEYDLDKAELLKKIENYEIKNEEYEFWRSSKAELELERRQLKDEVEKLQKEMQRQIADKDRERVQATDKLKNDMLHKIQETKTSLLALKREQLQTTTRLTVLQNHQLTTELEYQSKQTEKLLFKNSKLQEQVNTLKRDVEIHKQVEQELAKRSHFSQKLIKKLSQKIKELEEESENLKKNEQNNVNITKNGRESFQDDKTKDELITFLEKNLETIEKRLAKLQNDYDILKNENQHLQKKLDSKNDKYVNLATILAEKYEQTIQQMGVEDKNQVQLNLESIEQQDKFDSLKPEEKKALLAILLNQIKPFIKRKNLNLPEMQNLTIVIVNEKANSTLPRINSDAQYSIKEGKLDDISKEKSRFKDVPIDISTKVLRSNVREWGGKSDQPKSLFPKHNKQY